MYFAVNNGGKTCASVGNVMEKKREEEEGLGRMQTITPPKSKITITASMLNETFDTYVYIINMFFFEI